MRQGVRRAVSRGPKRGLGHVRCPFLGGVPPSPEESSDLRFALREGLETEKNENNSRRASSRAEPWHSAGRFCGRQGPLRSIEREFRSKIGRNTPWMGQRFPSRLENRSKKGLSTDSRVLIRTLSGLGTWSPLWGGSGPFQSVNRLIFCTRDQCKPLIFDGLDRTGAHFGSHGSTHLHNPRPPGASPPSPYGRKREMHTSIINVPNRN